MMEKVGMKVNGSKPASTYRSTGKIEEDIIIIKYKIYVVLFYAFLLKYTCIEREFISRQKCGRSS
jgi:hypothetical protein